MTSKEALERLFNDLKEFEEHFIGCVCSDSKEEYNLIKKDLEILEIIKKWSFIEESYKEGYGPYTKFQCIIHTIGMEEDFEKIKEWLENE